MNATTHQTVEAGAATRLRLGSMAALTAAFLLVACGGDGGGSAAPAPSPAPTPSPAPAPTPAPTPAPAPSPTAPSITTQPVAQTVFAPAAATFTVVAAGTSPLSYQWQESPAGSASFTDIAGATSASYTTPATSSTDSGEQFRVVVTNSAGSVTSNTVALQVGSGVLAGYPYAVSINSAGGLWAGVLPNIYTSTSQFAGFVQSVSDSGGVVTLAGSATQGFVNATGLAAEFKGPVGVVEDAAGNLYVADSGNSVLRKITPAGVVSTFATGFQTPRGIAIDSSGTLYVADRSANVIDKVTPSGTVSVLAGGGPGSHTDGTGTAASFSAPAGVAVDASGNVYVADGGAAVRKITAAGVVTTLAGNYAGSGLVDGTGSAARFSGLTGVAVDAAQNVYVADTDNNAIRVVTPAGAVTTLAGNVTAGFVDGTGTAASFNTPLAVAVDGSGNVYVADSGNHAIRKIAPGGVVTTLVY